MQHNSGGGKALGINPAIDFYDFQLLGHHLQKSNTTLITEEVKTLIFTCKNRFKNLKNNFRA